jgi:hypothetical protein
MRPRATHPVFGFTLLEICIAMVIAVLIVMVAVPSIKGVLKQNKAQDSFDQFEKLVEEAHFRSISERRAYILIWTPDSELMDRMNIVVRPDVPENDQEREGGNQVSLPTDEAPKIIFPASLLSGQPLAIWTFWSNGSCEPATVKYSGKLGKWTARYNAFTAQPEVSYE